MNETEKQIDYVMDNFNFEIVRLAMKLKDWKWADSDDSPTLEMLRETAHKLLQELVSRPEVNSVGTGGFVAFREKDSMNGNDIGLLFQLETVCTDEMEK